MGKTLRLFFLFLGICTLFLIFSFRTEVVAFFHGASENISNFFTRRGQCTTFIPFSADAEISAKEGIYVYSRYPFNDQSVLIIDAGSFDGIEEGTPVFAGERIILGKVKLVREKRSEVETIFNSDWRNSVAIGERRVKASLRGGVPPTLEFIPRDMEINVGDAVLSVSPDFPMNSFIGEVEEIDLSPDGVWKVATVRVPYNWEMIDMVFTEKKL